MKKQSAKCCNLQNKKDIKIAVYCRVATKEQLIDPKEEKVKKATEYLKNCGYIK